MRKLIILAGLFALVLTSCGPDEPMQMNYLYEAKSIPLSGIAVCCQAPGTTCLTSHMGFIPTSWKHYIETDSLAAYFAKENWEQDVPELADRPEIVKHILSENPRAVILDGFGVVILKGRENLSYDSSNVLVSIKLAPAKDCKEFLSQF